ncbi:MAG TPA: YciI family protein [Polyangiaceae bacterium]|nr:YciI family protein [Polyangiaceae bacterium]
MQFMVMHKMTQEMERGLPPDQGIIDGVQALIGDAIKAKAFVSGEGLHPSRTRTHVVYKNGKRTITDGPFTEAKELVGGFALMRVHSKEEALEWCDKFGAVIGDIEVHMGPVVEPWDLGMMPKPKNPPLRVLSMHQAKEGGPSPAIPPSPELMAKMGALVQEMTSAGVMQATGGLSGTKDGARIFFKGGKHTVVDGPFAESKELIAGYAILDLPSKADAIEWAIRFGEIVKVSEVEVRVVC